MMSPVKHAQRVSYEYPLTIAITVMALFLALLVHVLWG